MEETTSIQRARLYRSGEFNAGEISLLKWQYREHGGFFTALWSAISQADDDNLDRLSFGFPDHVQAYRDYVATGEFNRKLKAWLKRDSLVNQKEVSSDCSY